ncbi:Suppressor of glycerol defect 1 [Hyphodiscus hymeniophilus]|uniref:Suppressor of glycerol defect 1 n=1 Tax=Hyphodiscus hymeniophilus TaxID=353542 RepID=A0A9P7AVE7_9HELO|nr:Suppressor of glycerol defect 1 [Hyphodiscus hymeniophilus]
MGQKENVLKLPARLIEELGGQDVFSGGRNPRARGGSRKETRKAARVEKKSLRSGPPAQKRFKAQHTRELRVDDGPLVEKRIPTRKPLRNEEDCPPKPKSILKTTKKADPISHDESREVIEPVRVPRAVKQKLDEDDQEIAALEKKLGLKGKKKLPQSFKDDGLEDLLDGLDDGMDSDTQESKKRKAEGDEWLEQKRQKARKLVTSKDVDMMDEDELEDVEVEGESSEESSEAHDDGGASDMSLDGPEFPDDISGEELSEQDEEFDEDNYDDFDGFDSDLGDGNTGQPVKRVRENPYVAPAIGSNVQKYIPPSLRKPASSDSEVLIRLRRQTQGLVNRLTEANLISILGEIEKLYRDNARQHVTSTLVDLLLVSVCEPTSLPDTLIILPAGFIAAIYKIVGTDFGAQVIQRIVELFDEHYARATATAQEGPAAATSDSSKETSNLIMLLSELYNFQVVGSNLIFDYIRLFLGKLTELNAELLLKVIRTSGPQLRSDDPSSLKDIVSMLRPAVAAVGEENLSVRTKFMIETINDLKNNKMKTGGVASAVSSEHTIRMKKALGTLNTRSIKGSEPLRIGLKDIQESDKKGKWWLVGASWSGPTATEKTESETKLSRAKGHPVEESGTSDLVQLAREQRMNTDIRRAVFVAIMSASDYQDAYLRLMKLSLKKKQEYEIPKVLIHCAGAEKSYNPYYTLIAKKLCGDVKLKKSFQFSLWDLFRRMGESDDEDDVPEEDNEGDLDMRHLVNLAKMFGTLIAEGGLGLGVLKKLSLTYLQPKTEMFLEVTMITILLQSQKGSKIRDEEAVVSVFMKIKDEKLLIRGLQYFLKKVVRKTDIAGGEEEKGTVKWACKVASDTLQAVVAIDAAKD